MALSDAERVRVLIQAPVESAIFQQALEEHRKLIAELEVPEDK